MPLSSIRYLGLIAIAVFDILNYLLNLENTKWKKASQDFVIICLCFPTPLCYTL
ncbi:MAG: hypothetical protein HZA00_06140 [Nitrospinae bacterium]|nr:hypothetical protein [Nitrospinota bacterium]